MQTYYKMPRRFDGNVPHDGVHVATFTGARCPVTGEPELWQLYVRHLASKSIWLSVKLVGMGRVTCKGNYWFGWSIKERRHSQRPDAFHLASGRPELFSGVMQVLSELVEDHGDPRVLGTRASFKPYVLDATPSAPTQPLQEPEDIASVVPEPSHSATPSASPVPRILETGPGSCKGLDDDFDLLGDLNLL